MGGLGRWAHAEWVQRQRPMWREHDAKLASVWRRTDSDPRSGENVIVLPEAVDMVVHTP